ncbi:uncharacterized protein LOC142230732 [Haematobia irritans]|uniref:uncharacterized protein LOC142230732 n=1 Tax=Haematobia irritans TaxID=7368 RepID=UPI003F50AAA3
MEKQFNDVCNEDACSDCEHSESSDDDISILSDNDIDLLTKFLTGASKPANGENSFFEDSMSDISIMSDNDIDLLSEFITTNAKDVSNELNWTICGSDKNYEKANEKSNAESLLPDETTESPKEICCSEHTIITESNEQLKTAERGEKKFRRYTKCLKQVWLLNQMYPKKLHNSILRIKRKMSNFILSYERKADRDSFKNVTVLVPYDSKDGPSQKAISREEILIEVDDVPMPKKRRQRPYVKGSQKPRKPTNKIVIVPVPPCIIRDTENNSQFSSVQKTNKKEKFENNTAESSAVNNEKIDEDLTFDNIAEEDIELMLHRLHYGENCKSFKINRCNLNPASKNLNNRDWKSYRNAVYCLQMINGKDRITDKDIKNKNKLIATIDKYETLFKLENNGMEEDTSTPSMTSEPICETTKQNYTSSTITELLCESKIQKSASDMQDLDVKKEIIIPELETSPTVEKVKTNVESSQPSTFETSNISTKSQRKNYKNALKMLEKLKAQDAKTLTLRDKHNKKRAIWVVKKFEQQFGPLAVNETITKMENKDTYHKSKEHSPSKGINLDVDVSLSNPSEISELICETTKQTYTSELICETKVEEFLSDMSKKRIIVELETSTPIVELETSTPMDHTNVEAPQPSTLESCDFNTTNIPTRTKRKKYRKALKRLEQLEAQDAETLTLRDKNIKKQAILVVKQFEKQFGPLSEIETNTKMENKDTLYKQLKEHSPPKDIKMEIEINELTNQENITSSHINENNNTEIKLNKSKKDHCPLNQNPLKEKLGHKTNLIRQNRNKKGKNKKSKIKGMTASTNQFECLMKKNTELKTDISLSQKDEEFTNVFCEKQENTKNLDLEKFKLAKEFLNNFSNEYKYDDGALNNFLEIYTKFEYNFKTIRGLNSMGTHDLPEGQSKVMNVIAKIPSWVFDDYSKMSSKSYKRAVERLQKFDKRNPNTDTLTIGQQRERNSMLIIIYCYQLRNCEGDKNCRAEILNKIEKLDLTTTTWDKYQDEQVIRYKRYVKYLGFMWKVNQIELNGDKVEMENVYRCCKYIFLYEKQNPKALSTIIFIMENSEAANISSTPKLIAVKRVEIIIKGRRVKKSIKPNKPILNGKPIKKFRKNSRNIELQDHELKEILLSGVNLPSRDNEITTFSSSNLNEISPSSQTIEIMKNCNLKSPKDLPTINRGHYEEEEKTKLKLSPKSEISKETTEELSSSLPMEISHNCVKTVDDVKSTISNPTKIFPPVDMELRNYKRSRSTIWKMSQRDIRISPFLYHEMIRFRKAIYITKNFEEFNKEKITIAMDEKAISELEKKIVLSNVTMCKQYYDIDEDVLKEIERDYQSDNDGDILNESKILGTSTMTPTTDNGPNESKILGSSTMTHTTDNGPNAMVEIKTGENVTGEKRLNTSPSDIPPSKISKIDN